MQRGRGYVGTKLCPFPCFSVCTQLLVSRPDEENITSYLQLIEKCLTHEVRPSLGLHPSQSPQCPRFQPILYPLQCCLQRLLSFCTHSVGSDHLPPVVGASTCPGFPSPPQNTPAGSGFLAPSSSCSQGEMPALSYFCVPVSVPPANHVSMVLCPALPSPHSRRSQRHRRSGCCPGSSKC